MRALLWMHPRGKDVPGGHLTQLEQTAAAIRDLGVDADVFFDDAPDLSSYDVVHGFGLESRHVRTARSRGIPVALSTIYWSRDYTEGRQRPLDRTLIKDRLRLAGVLAVRAAQGRAAPAGEGLIKDSIERMMAYETADLLLPNSQAEGQCLMRELGVSTPWTVVPNAVDPDRFSVPGMPFEQRTQVFAVGRIEPHKNQLSVIKALSGVLPLTVVGREHPHHPDYYRACRAAAGPDVTFIGDTPHSELPELYGTARVHVLASWYETTGLVSLEAALAGASVVSTDRGFAHEYLLEDAAYCDPSSLESIRAAVQRAYASPPPAALIDRINGSFSWTHTAQATVAAYEALTRSA